MQLISLLFESHHDLRRAVLDYELNAVQSLQYPSPFVGLRLELEHHKSDNPVHVRARQVMQGCHLLIVRSVCNLHEFGVCDVPVLVRCCLYQHFLELILGHVRRVLIGHR